MTRIVLLVSLCAIGCGPLDSPGPTQPAYSPSPTNPRAPQPPNQGPVSSGTPTPGTPTSGTPTPGTPPGTSAGSSAMRTLEAEIVVAMNRLRANPAAFVSELQTYRSYYDAQGIIHFPGREVGVLSNEGTPAVDEAIAVAKTAKPIQTLTVSAGLSRAAREHAQEIGRAGHINHRNSAGEEPHERMERYGTIIGYSGENIGTGDAGGSNMVIGLFVDDGVPSRGHRDNLLNGAYGRVGVGCAPHSRWEIVCVIDTAEDYRER